VRHALGGTTCRVLEEGEDRGELRVLVPGLHNLRNALGASAAARHLGVDWDAIRRGLEGFSGVSRRFQRLGEFGGVALVDDYAHHPTEIDVTLAATRNVYPGRRVIAVFQPHLYSRTRDFMAAFGESLAAADRVFVSDVYPAREEPIEGITGERVAEAVERARDGDDPRVSWLPTLDDIGEAIVTEVRPGDVVVTMGAGSIETLAPVLAKALESRDG
jgi:UDP-N-acetylmuramate--alanine ligase